MKRIVFLAAALIIVLATIAACAPAPTPVPTAAPPTAAPKATEAPKATAAPTAAPTQAAAAATVPAPKCDKMAGALSPKAGELGAPDKPIVITFVPSVDVGKITKGGQSVADCLGKMTGLTFKVEVGTSEAASIEALGGGKAQFGFLNTFPILLAKQKYGVEVSLVALRYYGIETAAGKYTTFAFDPDKDLVGKVTPYYKAEFYARKDTGIKSYADLKGHTFCFTSASSTSGNIIPRAVLKANGIDPDKDIKSTLAGGHDKAAIAVYQGDCDAGVGFMDILTDKPTNLAAKFPDITEKVIPFAVTDRIPNDGFQVIKGLDPKIKGVTVDALVAMMADPGGNAVVKSIYNYDGFEKVGYDKYYQPFEDLLLKAGVDVKAIVK